MFLQKTTLHQTVTYADMIIISMCKHSAGIPFSSPFSCLWGRDEIGIQRQLLISPLGLGSCHKWRAHCQVRFVMVAAFELMNKKHKETWLNSRALWVFMVNYSSTKSWIYLERFRGIHHYFVQSFYWSLLHYTSISWFCFKSLLQHQNAQLARHGLTVTKTITKGHCHL